MKSMASRYASTIRRSTELFAAWPIGTALELGDVGYLDRRTKLFERRAHLDDYKVAYSIRTAPKPTDIDVTVGKGLGIKFKAAGAAPMAGSHLLHADVGVSIKVGKTSAVVVRAHCVESGISDIEALQTQVIALRVAHPDRWDEDFVILTSIYRSTGTTVILSGSRGSVVDISAGGAARVPFDLADVGIGLTALSNSSKFISALAQAGFVPFFQAHRLAGARRGQLKLKRYGA